MMQSIGAQSLILLRLLSGLVLVCVEESAPLELIPSVSEVLLSPNASFTVVCSGWSEVGWQLPQDWDMDGLVVENQGSRSILQLNNATWMHSGKYTCEEPLSDQTREINIFIPGQGPDEWFVPVGSGHVMKDGEEGTIPCVVSDPQLNVSLYQRPDRMLVTSATYDPSQGFRSPLNDTSYLCMASHGGEQRDSQVYYVFSIVVPEVTEVELTASSSVLLQGEVLMVNCTANDAEMVFFSWDFPRRQDFEPLTDFLPSQIRSFFKISPVTLADSGVYECAVQETVQQQTVKKNITVTVLERGYIRLHHLAATNVSSLLHHTVVFSVNIDAYPAPTVIWTKSNHTVAMETTTVTTTHLMDSRYVTSLVLVRIQMDQRGRYTVNISNDDDFKEVVFNLEVKAPPRITSLAEVSGQTVLCVSEGAPPPSITWYTCHSSHRCGNLTGGWQNLSAVSEGVALRENITEEEEGGGLAQVRSELTLRTLGSLRAVRCEARNSAGRRAWDLRLPSSSLISQVAVLSVVLVLVAITIIFLIILIILWKKKPRYEVHWKVIESVSHDGLQYNYLDPAHLPYNSAWEIPRDDVALGPVLGSGAFGRVVQASVSGLFHSRSVTKAAVKMVKPSSGAAQSLMSELKVLIHLGPHMNVVNLLGACTRDGPIYLITEFCCHGDLAIFLQRNKHTFQQSDSQQKSDTDGGYMDMNKEDSAQYVAMEQLSYATIQPTMYETPYSHKDQQADSVVYLSESPVLSLQDLLSFSFQVAQAMDFLSSRNCVHRDLAARNVLVCEGKLVKIGDFGLVRDLFKDQDYVTKGNAFLPVKWMAPESIFQSIYSCQSDVWSYGVLLWEIFSLGESPYPDLPMTQEFYVRLKRGYRMSCPDYAMHSIYELMMQCWEEDPQSRPSFSSLVLSVGNMLTNDYKERYFQLLDNFVNGDSPAVVRSRLSPIRSTDKTNKQMEGEGSHCPQVGVHLSEEKSLEAGPSSSTYIITDAAIEGSGGPVLDTVSPQLSDSLPDINSHDAPPAQEVTSSQGGPEEEESHL